jgi:hypothetical protein
MDRNVDDDQHVVVDLRLEAVTNCSIGQGSSMRPPR